MLEYCDPPAGIFEWKERSLSWSDPHSSEELRAKRALGIALNAARSLPNISAFEKRFQAHAAQWERDVRHLSSPSQMTFHPSYQAVLGMAQENENDIIRLMLIDLRDNRRPWFLALSYLTKENPIRSADAGKVDKMIKSWVEWGRNKRLL